MDALDIAFPVFLTVMIVSGGLAINSSINEDIRKRECRVELVKQTKLDTPNILLICEGK